MSKDDLWVVQSSIEYPGGKTYLSVVIFAVKDGQIVHGIDDFAEPSRRWIGHD